jgi:hypothetical protein
LQDAPGCFLHYLFFGLCGALALQHDTLELFKNRKLLIGMVNLGVTLLFGNQKAYFFQTLQFTLNITGVFFDELSQSPDVRLEVGVFCVDDYDLSSNS